MMNFDYVEEDPYPFAFAEVEVGDRVVTGSSNSLYSKGTVAEIKKMRKSKIVKVSFSNGFFGWFGICQLVKVEGAN